MRRLEYWLPLNFGHWFVRLILSYLLFALIGGVGVIMVSQTLSGNFQFSFWGAGVVGVIGVFLLLRERVFEH